MHFMRLLVLVTGYIAATIAISLDISSDGETDNIPITSFDQPDPESIKDAAKIAAQRMVSYYFGNKPGGTPGLLPPPHYWWEAGGMFGSLIEYWHYTGDAQFNSITSDAMLFQASPSFNYMPLNQTKNEGNDDQAFWAFTVMSAAEYAFPNPPQSHPSWVAMAQAVWNSQAYRWDESSCGGGLRWQIQSYNTGWNYKNTASNAGFMNLGARLYAYTGNETYRDYVKDSWTWMEAIGLISPDYLVFDGSDDNLNCTELDHTRWSYNAGMVLHTAAVMWNKTENETWKHRTNGVWNSSAAAFFTEEKVMYESACEPFGKTNNCNLDQQSFKAYYTRFIAAAIKSAPYLYSHLQPYLEASAYAAAASCIGGDSGTDCPTKWTLNGTFDGSTGMGQQMSAMNIFTANLIDVAKPPVNEKDGGISTPNATFGTGGDPHPEPPVITKNEKTGAIILTVGLILCTIAGGVYGGWLPHNE